MSLFGAIQMAGNSLNANQIALQVIGQNISNANTPGYIREQVVLTPAATYRKGGLLLGLGVEVQAVVQKIDNFLEERLRGAVSDQASTTTTQQAYSQLEGITGELGDTDLSSMMNNFLSSISEILNQPQDRATRNLAILQGQSLTQEINRLASRTIEVHNDVDTQIQNMAGDMNRLIDEIQQLNLQIAQAEGGTTSRSDAVGLRDKRLQALENLAKMIDVRVVEQPSGGVTVYAGGNYLVSEGIARHVECVLDSEHGLSKSDIHLIDTDSPLNPSTGQLRGLINSRDQVLGGFLDRLDDFTRTLTYEFNKLYSGGQGLVGFSSLESEFQVDDVDAPLNDAGLPHQAQNGSFQILLHDTKTGLTQTTDITVDLNGLNHDMTLSDLATALDQIDGLKATLTPSRGLKLECDSADQELAFANDTSGVLAALGLNTFFSGSNATDIRVNAAVRAEPALFAASRGGIGADTDNAVDLAAFLTRPLASQNGASIGDVYSRMISETTQGATTARSEAEGATTYAESLRGQKLSISGVNLDEEAIQMITYQRAFQASAKFIAVVSDMLDVLVKL